MPRVPLKKGQKSMTEHDMNSYSSLQSGDKRGKIFLFPPYFVGELSIKCSSARTILHNGLQLAHRKSVISHRNAILET